MCALCEREPGRGLTRLPRSQLSSIGLFGSGKEGLRQRKDAQSAPRLLTRLEQLRLLSKAVRPLAPRISLFPHLTRAPHAAREPAVRPAAPDAASRAARSKRACCRWRSGTG